jgi:RNA recognition motif-containing protein
MHTKILLIENLDAEATEAELIQLAAAYGGAERAEIVKDRKTGQPKGHAFLHLRTFDSTDRAAEELNGKELRGKVLTVTPYKVHRSQADHGMMGGGGHSAVFGAKAHGRTNVSYGRTSMSGKARGKGGGRGQ